MTDPKALLAADIGHMVITMAEQAAVITNQATEIERLKAMLATTPVDSSGAATGSLPTMGQPG